MERKKFNIGDHVHIKGTDYDGIIDDIFYDKPKNETLSYLSVSHKGLPTQQFTANGKKLPFIFVIGAGSLMTGVYTPKQLTLYDSALDG